MCPLLYGPSQGDRGGRREGWAGLVLTGPADREGIPCYVRVTQGPSVGEASDSPFVPPNAGLCVLLYTMRGAERGRTAWGQRRMARLSCYWPAIPTELWGGAEATVTHRSQGCLYPLGQGGAMERNP